MKATLKKINTLWAIEGREIVNSQEDIIEMLNNSFISSLTETYECEVEEVPNLCNCDCHINSDIIHISACCINKLKITKIY